MPIVLKRTRCEETAHKVMTVLKRRLALAALLMLTQAAAGQAAETIRLAVQKTGTFSWELATIRSMGLDKEADLSLEVTELASPEAGKIAMRAGNADIMLSDWLWVSRERALGARLTFYPYSTALGAVMVPAASPIKTLTDLRGRKLGVAGGAIDKSWLLLQARMKQDGVNLKSDASIVYGAPPLIAAKALDGEMEASLNFWNFCAQLEAKGFRRLAGIEEILPQLGAKGAVSAVGYVFEEGWAASHREAVSRFIAMTRKAKQLLVSSDAAWDKVAPLTGTTDPVLLKTYRDRYRDGIPRRSIADEEADARVLYRVLAEIGGRDLVGPAAELDPGTFYHAGPGD